MVFVIADGGSGSQDLAGEAAPDDAQVLPQGLVVRGERAEFFAE